MLVECPHCHGYAEVHLNHDGPVDCPACRRTYTIGEDPLLAGGESVVDGSAPKAERSLLDPPETDPFGLTGPPQSMNFAALTADNFEAIQELPGGGVDFDALSGGGGGGMDLSALMDAEDRAEEDGSWDATRTVSASESEDIVGRLRADEETTRAAELDDSGAVWRVRSDRGLVYELMSLDAVVAWLEGKADVSGVLIARGVGDFQPITDHPELAARMGVRAAPDPFDSPLELEERAAAPLAPAPGMPPAAQRDVSPLRAPEDKARKPAEVPARPLGFGVVLGVALTAMALVAAAVVFGLRVGVLPETRPPAVVARLGPPAPALQAAIDAFEAGHHTTAVAQLRALAGEDADPRVYRYLALTLARSERPQDAERALARYRRAMSRMNGEHGRQVRELRD